LKVGKSGGLKKGRLFFLMMTALRGGAPRLALDFGGLMHEHIAQGDQSAELLAIYDGKVAESEFAHDEKAFFDAFVGGNGTRIGGHYFRNRGGAGRAARGHHAIHNVALGENAG
jgi:hypothetical protein